VSRKTEKALVVLDPLAPFGIVSELLAPNGIRGLHHLVASNVRAMQHDNAFLVGSSEAVRLRGDVLRQRLGSS